MQPVITLGQIFRKDEHAARLPAPRDLRTLQLGQITGANARGELAPVRANQPPFDRLVQCVRRQRQDDTHAARTDDGDGGQERPPPPGIEIVDLASDRVCVGHVAAHRRQDRRLGGGTESLQHPAVIVVRIADSAAACKTVEEGIEHKGRVA